MGSRMSSTTTRTDAWNRLRVATRCAAHLAARSANDTHCNIYEWRPGPCREFREGDDACRTGAGSPRSAPLPARQTSSDSLGETSARRSSPRCQARRRVLPQRLHAADRLNWAMIGSFFIMLPSPPARSGDL